MSVTILSFVKKSIILWKIFRLISIIGCVLTMRAGLTQVNTAMPIQTFLDSKHIAFQKNISNIKKEPDISFQFFCQLIRLCQIKLCLVRLISSSKRPVI
uniref:Uncharacterized protein n=1 Tax=Wolbachia endosymbiont of Aleurodicus floccissimus TaxID=2152762 RepID=A0A3B0J0R4_9RICK